MTLTKQIFITGASGCVGHYLIAECLKIPTVHVHGMVRDTKKLNIKPEWKGRVTVHEGDMEYIERLKPIIQKCQYVIHAATAWGGGDFARVINVEKTKALFLMTNPEICEQIIYFSTASILGKNGVTIPEICKQGSGYIRSKSLGYEMIQTLPIKDRITTIFPTMVFGGDTEIPQSHITSGIIPNLKLLRILKYVYVGGAFHFLHAEDIATVVIHLLFNANNQRTYILGNNPITVKETLEKLVKAFGRKPWMRVHIPYSVIYFLAKIFRIKIGKWEQHCIGNPYMVFNTVSPESFGLKTQYPTLESILLEIKNIYK